MAVSRKHFKLIADALHAQRPEKHWDANKRTQWELDVKAIADALSNMNPRFDRYRFERACGLDEEYKAA